MTINEAHTMARRTIPTLSEEAAAAFSAYRKHSIEKRKLNARARTATEKRDEAREIVVGEMGRFKRAQLPDGRVIQRIPQGFHKKAQPACDVKWEDLIESE
jgi:hypothetical protein